METQNIKSSYFMQSYSRRASLYVKKVTVIFCVQVFIKRTFHSYIHSRRHLAVILKGIE